MRTTWLLPAIIFFIFSHRSLSPAAEKLDIGAVIQKSEERYGAVNSYTCLFSKKELSNGAYVVQNNIAFKFRKPDNFYMKWADGEMKGTEVIYAGKKYGFKMAAHAGGLLKYFTQYLDPSGYMAMRNNRHPITEAHLGNFLELVRANYNLHLKTGKGKILFIKKAEAAGRKCLYFRGTFPAGSGFYGALIDLYYDEEKLLPVRIAVYGWQNELLEDYTFSSLQINPGLADLDFDIDNKAYEFK